MVSDYADSVRFFEHPQVNREFIAQDQINYRSKLQSHSERIPGALDFVNFTVDRATVVYDLKVSSIDLRGKPSEITAKIRLELVKGPNGWKITSHTPSK
jgi:hypothetical protein